MKAHSLSAALLACCLVVGSWLMLPASLTAAGQYEEEVSTTEYLFVKGMIRTISLADQSITLQQKKGPVLTISIHPETEFEGVQKLEDLQIRQVIKLWYQPEHGGNSALKIVKLPDTGC